MKNRISGIWKKITQHKKLTAFVILVVIIGGYYGYEKLNSSTGETKYVLAAVEKGTLITSVSGSGQVSALNQTDIKPEVSGKVLLVLKKNGQYIPMGGTIAQLDTQDAEKAIRDAESSLESTQLQFSISNESDSKLISDGFNQISDTFLDLPSTVSGIEAALFDKTIASYENLIDWEGRDMLRPLIRIAETSYGDARDSYDKAFDDYHSISRYDASSTIASFITKTLNTSTKLSDAIKNTINLIDFINDYNIQRNKTLSTAYANLILNYRSNLVGYTSKVNSHITSLASIQSSIKNSPLNIASQNLTLKQRENSLQDTKDAIADYTIRAPFSGIIAKLNIKAGDSISPSTAVATLITSDMVAGASFNEVDVSKIRIGQKATLTFDAIDGLSIAGNIQEIDSIGTVTQGVVIYNVKIGFSTQDSRVRSGMNVTAAVITNAKQDALLIPASAVKSQGNESYVEVLDGVSGIENINSKGIASIVLPTQKTVETGDSNDSMIEIKNGLQEGDLVITRTITAASQTQSQTTQSSSFRIPGLGGGR